LALRFVSIKKFYLDRLHSVQARSERVSYAVGPDV